MTACCGLVSLHAYAILAQVLMLLTSLPYNAPPLNLSSVFRHLSPINYPGFN